MSQQRPALSFYYCSPPLKSTHDLDEVRSTSTQRTGPFSLGSPHSHKGSVQRVNQIKPKPKIKLPNSQPPKPPPIRKLYTQPEEKIQPQLPVIHLDDSPSTSKPKKGGLLSWVKLDFLCGMGASSQAGDAGEGCSCGPPCRVREEWVSSQQESDRVTYAKLREEKPNSQCMKQIEKDLDRTYPGSPTFAHPRFRKSLEEVLVVYSIYDMELGYVQGLNTLAAVLLFHLKDPEETFWALVDLM